MNPYGFVEESLQSLEKLTGLKLTVIDNDGIFNLKQSRRVFTSSRASHQKNAVCRIDFSDRCIENCRFKMNQKCAECNAPFISTCWKGVSQLVIPLNHDLIHYGMLYAGVFRDAKSKPCKGLSKAFEKAFYRLPVLDENVLNSLIPLLTIYADGIMFFLRKSNIVSDEYDLRVRKISDFIGRNLNRRIGIPDLASELGLSNAHTSVTVKKLFGTPFSVLLMQKRLKAVEYYLVTTDIVLHKIAGLCGFSSEFHMSKAFRRAYGVPPGHFRRRKKVENL